MYPFKYHRPVSVADAASLMASRGEARLLAGGMSLIPALKLRLARYSDLVDLRGIADMKGIRRDGNALVIGAMTPHAEVAASPVVIETIPALASLAEGIGDPLVRNRGTIGGSIAHCDPAADYPAGVLGLGATVVTNRREIAADDFFLGQFETALEPAEIIVAIRFPLPPKAAYLKLPQPASRFAIVGVFVASTDRGTRVAVTGAAPSVFRFRDAEAALDRKFEAAGLDGVKLGPDGLNSDIHASADYRAHCTMVMTRRAVTAAR